ncbi:MAG: polysaccharide biosynthesis protein, partial [Vagococcus sp.]
MSDKTLEKNMLQGTVILTLTSFVVKVLSAVYRVPYQNLVGDEGFYVYQQIYPIYGIGMTLALTGLPVYLSKLLAACSSQKEQEKTLNAFFTVVSGLSLLLFGSLYALATPIARLMGDVSLSPLIQVVSFVFLLVPFLSTYRGFFQGQLEMKPTAISQLVEQGSRVLVILGAGYLFTILDWTVYDVGNVAMSGAIVGGLFALVILWYYGRRRSFSVRLRKQDSKELRQFTKKLLKEGGTLCFFSAYLIVFQLVDAFSVKQFLVYGGMDDLSAKIAKGVFDRGQPLVQLGLVVAVSMTAAFLPPLTKHFMNKDKRA